MDGGRLIVILKSCLVIFLLCLVAVLLCRLLFQDFGAVPDYAGAVLV